MKPVSFEGSTNSIDVEEWLSTIEIILEFMELNDEKKIICVAYALKVEARYWWEVIRNQKERLGDDMGRLCV